jgi:hypothetical protein
MRPIIAASLAALLAAGCKPQGQDARSGVKSENRARGEFKGYVAIQTRVQDTMFAPQGKRRFQLGWLIGDVDPLKGGLGVIMGAIVKPSGREANRYANMVPNGMSMMLWDLTMLRLAEALGKSCGQTTLAFDVVSSPTTDLKSVNAANKSADAAKAPGGDLGHQEAAHHDANAAQQVQTRTETMALSPRLVAALAGLCDKAPDRSRALDDLWRVLMDGQWMVDIDGAPSPLKDWKEPFLNGEGKDLSGEELIVAATRTLFLSTTYLLE